MILMKKVNFSDLNNAYIWWKKWYNFNDLNNAYIEIIDIDWYCIKLNWNWLLLLELYISIKLLLV